MYADYIPVRKIADPYLLFSDPDPDPSWWVILDPDLDPTGQVISILDPHSELFMSKITSL